MCPHCLFTALARSMIDQGMNPDIVAKSMCKTLAELIVAVQEPKDDNAAVESFTRFLSDYMMNTRSTTQPHTTRSSRTH